MIMQTSLENNLNPELKNWIKQIIATKYRYGFRIGFSIELAKLRKFAESEGVELNSSDSELEMLIKAAGVLVDGKIHVFSDEYLFALGDLFDRIFQSGVKAVFFSPFIEHHADWLEENFITSEILIKESLKLCRPNFFVGKNFVSEKAHITEREAIVSEINRVSSSSSVIRIERLLEPLKYIPTEKINRYLSSSDDFVWINEGTYFRMECFVSSPEDREKICEYVSKECNNKGYASFVNLPMGNIPEENYELSTTALYSAVYNAILKDEYFVNGKVISRERHGANITTLLNDYCLDRGECTVSEMVAYAESLTGLPYRQCVMEILYDSFVRVDSDRFISEKTLSFDVQKIDELLEDVIGNGFSPIKQISTFILFPPCGVGWNYYVLESFCHRFSEKYKLLVLNYNDRNAGIITAKDLSLTYEDVLSEAIAHAEIELNPDVVGEFLFKNSYTAKRKYSCMPRIIAKAKDIREES